MTHFNAKLSNTLFAALVLLPACGGSELDASPATASPEPSASAAPSAAAPVATSDAALFAEGQQQLAVRADSLNFVPCSAEAPNDGCEMAVLAGSPKGDGLYTIRFRTTGPIAIPPHSHPGTERATVLEGTVHVGFGDQVDKSQGAAFGPGDLYMNAPGSVHYLWSEGPVVLQVTGRGPRIFNGVHADHQ